jgi:TP901 family phage tail tape measure protein
MVEAATNFRKSGFNNADSAILAQVAAQYQNIADTAVSASDAAASITSQIRAFGEDASFATTVINAYNEVANNFSVGTNDISNAMEIASSGMATYGNSFQQVIGLVTSGTEIMQGRASQVARGLSTIAARIVKNQDALAEYGIQVEKTDGSLKSTFDVLSELKPKWDAMTDAQRVALGDTIAGQNQYKVLASVMSNFQHAIDATNTALESAGSAAKENAAYMESLEAKENALKAEFEDFANRVLSKDVVKGFLEAGTSMLDFANNDVGAAITRIGLLTTGMTGLTGIVGQTIGKIAEVGLQLKNLGVSGGSFLGMLASGKVALIVGGVVLAVTALVEVIRALKSSYDAAHPSFEQANENLEKTQDEISQTTDKLKEYKDQLAKLDEVDVEDRGAAWQSERSELELNIEASQSYLDVLERIRELQGQQAYAADRPIGYTAAGSIAKNQFQDETYYGAYQATGDRSVQLSAKQANVLNAQYSDQYQALTAITLALADATDEQYRYIEAEDLAELQGKSQEEQIEIMTDMLGKLGIALNTTYESSEQAFSNMGELANKTGELSQAQKEQAQAYIDSYGEIVKVGAATKEQVTAYVELAAKLNDVDIASGNAYEKIALLANVLGVTPAYARDLAISMGLIDANTRPAAGALVQLENGTWAVADGLNVVKTASDGVGEATSGISVATYDTSTAAAQLTASLFDQNGQLTEAGLQALSVDSSMRSLATSELQAQQAAAQANYANLIIEIQKVGSAAMITAGQLSQMMALAGVGSAQGLVGGLASGANTDIEGLKSAFFRSFGKSADANVADFNKWVSSRVSAAGQSTYDKIMEETQKRLDELEKNFPSGGGGGGGSSRKSAEEKAAEEAEKQAKKAQKAQEKAAKQSQQAYESAASSAEQAAQEAARAAEQAAEEAKQKILDSIQELKDASDDFWDSKTDAIEETNKELDRQKQLEEKLKALEEAKQKKILLYKNGQFQYDKDYGTIAKAQADYEETRDKIQRERELEQLEEMKDNATEIFNEMKDIVQNGGNVTQEMINNWLKNMAASGADYYDSNKKLLNEWLDWARNALQTYGQGVVDAVNGYVSTSSLMSSGTYGSNAQGMVATDTNGARYLADRNSDNPLYWDKDGNFVGFTKAFWIDVFDTQIKKGQFGDYKTTDAWLGNLPGTSIFDDWEEVFKYWSSQEHADIYALQDMVDRFDAAKQVFQYYKDIFKSLGYDEYAKMAEQYDNIDSSKYSRMAWQMSMVQHPDDPFGWRSYEPAWRGTRREDTAELWQTMNDILDMMWANNYQGNAYKTALGEAERASKRDWHINRMDESDRYEYATFDLDKLKAALEENEEAIKQLSEKWFEAATDLERQAIAVEAESRRKFRDLGYAQLGIDTTAQSEAERAANRQPSGKTLDEARRDKKLANNVDAINKTLEKVDNGQAISQGYITQAKDYIAKKIEENSERWFTLYDQTEKDKLHQQTEELRALQDKLQKANDLAEINNLLVHGEGLLPNEKADFEDEDWKDDKKYDDWVREAEDLDDTAEDIRRQMELNAKRWFDADEKTKDELHRANEELAERLTKETGTNLSYSGATGKWSKNATGTRNFRGGLSLVGERGPEMRILGQGDNVIPANQTANLWKWSNTTPQQMLTTLSARSGSSNTSYAFDVSRIELPNVTDAKSFVQGLKNYALQYSYKR